MWKVFTEDSVPEWDDWCSIFSWEKNNFSFIKKTKTNWKSSHVNLLCIWCLLVDFYVYDIALGAVRKARKSAHNTDLLISLLGRKMRYT